MSAPYGQRPRHVVVTGGAGYIGSRLVGALLRRGDRVTVVDRLLFGGESLLGLVGQPGFSFARADVGEAGALKAAVSQALRDDRSRPDAFVHLAALVGFPACQELDRDLVWRTNVEAARWAVDLAESLGAGRFILASTCSVYGAAKTSALLSEDSPLNPQSLYAESKIAAEQAVLQAAQGGTCAPLVFRLATLYGPSPRMRFDLLVNQFTMQALTQRELVVYEGQLTRTFLHVGEAVRGFLAALDAPLETIHGRILNLGHESGNLTKIQVAERIRRVLPQVHVRDEALRFDGDMRDMRVSYRKVREVLGFEPEAGIDDGIRQVLGLLRSGLLEDPTDLKYRNAASPMARVRTEGVIDG